MVQTYVTGTGRETLRIEQESDSITRLTVADENGEASVVLDAGALRKLMTVIGVFVEPYPGAWSRSATQNEE